MNVEFRRTASHWEIFRCWFLLATFTDMETLTNTIEDYMQCNKIKFKLASHNVIFFILFWWDFWSGIRIYQIIAPFSWIVNGCLCFDCRIFTCWIWQSFWLKRNKFITWVLKCRNNEIWAYVSNTKASLSVIICKRDISNFRFSKLVISLECIFS